MKRIISIFSVGLIIIISSFNLFAQQQLLPPKNFNVGYEPNADISSSIIIEFDANEHSLIPDAYNIYYTYGEQEKIIEVATIKHLPNQKHYSHIIQNLKPGTYHFFATAVKFKENGEFYESEKTETIDLRIGEFSKNIYFLSHPLTKAILDEKYVYQILVKTQLNCHIKLEILEGPDGMYLEDNNLIWEPKNPGEYKVSLKASLPDCNTDEYAIQEFIINVIHKEEHPYVKIHHIEKMVVKIGETITERILAESNVNCPIIFNFEGDFPENFKWDEDGTFNFTPMHPGEYHIAIFASLECMPDIYDKFELFILVSDEEPNHKYCSIIKGSVNFDDQNPVPSGYVSAVKIDRNDNDLMPVFKTKIIEGKFELSVPEGNYAIDIRGELFYPEWYQDADYITEAERITINCNETKEITAFVKPLPIPEHFKVTGRVYDAESDGGIFAIVRFIPVQLIFDNNKGNTEIPIFEARTDENGYYEITLPDNFTYVAQSISAMNNKQYKIQYYNQVYTPYEADLINLTADLEEIDFPMIEIEHKIYGFSGGVFNENNEPLKAMLIAVCIHPKDKNTPPNFTQTTYTNDEGIYKFDGLIEGEYVVLSIPSDPNYVPGYYNNNDFVVQKWQESKTINVQENMITMQFDFKHKQRGELGLIIVNGKIYGHNGIITKDNYSQESNPISGVFVYGINQNGNISDFAFTNENGEFTLDELPSGDIKIIADKIGMNFSEKNIKTDYEENPEMNLQIFLDETATSVSDFNNSSFQVFPIPASDCINISLNNFNSPEVVIYDLLGNKIYQEQFASPDIKLDVTKFVNGNYILKISQGSFAETKLISIYK